MRGAWPCALLSSFAIACSGAPARPPPAPVREGPETSILRIASVWEARHTERGLRSAPSPVASFESQQLTRLTLVAGQPSTTELLSLSERFMLRDGTEVRCGGELESEVTVSYGRRAGEPALELAWPAVSRQRACDSAGAPIPPFERPAGRARFVLRSDQLVAVEPPLEKRVFFPVE